MLEDFIVFGTSTADPWNRMNCCQHPSLVLIEFCQMQGPKPVMWCPENPGDHMDLDHVAIWLMSSENVHGSTTIVFNQQMAVYALVRHSTMLDITARAFQRPFCLALLSATRPTAKIVSKFESIADELVNPLLECNRRLFSRFLDHMIDLEENLRNEDFHRFYAFLPPDGPSATFSNKIRSVAKQANKLGTRFREAYNMNSSESCTCGVDYDDLFEYFPFLEQPNAILLMPLFQLAPCVKDFTDSFQIAYNSLIQSTKSQEYGILFSNGTSVFRSMTNAGINLSTTNDVHTEKPSSNGHNENVLSSLSTALVHCLFPLLAGERIAILASKQRKVTGMDLMHKLNALAVKKNIETVRWSEEDNRSTDQNSQLHNRSQ
uniref:UDENN FLCN/SMCR8-type domain-containing protein n=1 Tax=Acrobeloides nanus TaxID=290746 RepID=A0A914EM44_9BILA